MPKTTNVSAVLLDGEDKHARAKTIPGAFWYAEAAGVEDAYILHSCPCGCGVIGGLQVKPVDPKRPCWAFSGARESPTLSPSVAIHLWEPNESNLRAAEKEADGYHWHGWLRNGVWESC